MIVSDLSVSNLAARLGSQGLRLRTGPIVIEVRTHAIDLADGLRFLYGHHPVEDSNAFADFHVAVRRPAGIRRWVRPQVSFTFDGYAPFTPLPADHALPLMEWGFNWCVSSHYDRCVVIHAAAIERNGKALIFPAPPGSGKSTLTAGLINRGWRLLSDELTLLDPLTGRLLPLARPVSLKNASIDVIRNFAPDAAISAIVHDTTKGSVAHMAPPVESVLRADEPALPGWVVMPRYEAGVTMSLAPLAKGKAMMQLADNAFNYSMHGRKGFELLAALVSQCDCYELVYSDLDAAASLFERLPCGLH